MVIIVTAEPSQQNSMCCLLQLQHLARARSWRGSSQLLRQRCRAQGCRHCSVPLPILDVDSLNLLTSASSAPGYLPQIAHTGQFAWPKNSLNMLTAGKCSCPQGAPSLCSHQHKSLPHYAHLPPSKNSHQNLRTLTPLPHNTHSHPELLIEINDLRKANNLNLQ